MRPFTIDFHTLNVKVPTVQDKKAIFIIEALVKQAFIKKDVPIKLNRFKLFSSSNSNNKRRSYQVKDAAFEAKYFEQFSEPLPASIRFTHSIVLSKDLEGQVVYHVCEHDRKKSYGVGGFGKVSPVLWEISVYPEFKIYLPKVPLNIKTQRLRKVRDYEILGKEIFHTQLAYERYRRIAFPGVFNARRSNANLSDKTTYKIMDEGAKYVKLRQVREHFEGVTLNIKLADRSFIHQSPIQLLNIFRKLVVAVQEQCHDLGFIHGDLKPRNVIIGKDHSIHLIDFGFSAPLNQSLVSSSGGTAAFNAPEKYRKMLKEIKKASMMESTSDSEVLSDEANEANETSGIIIPKRFPRKLLAHPVLDLYSLGVILLQLLSKSKTPGRVYPTTCQTYLREKYKDSFKDAIWIDTLPELEPIYVQINYLLSKLICLKPSDRFQSCKALLIALDRILIDDSDDSLVLSRSSDDSGEEESLNMSPL